jgi:hypothetical protein
MLVRRGERGEVMRVQREVGNMLVYPWGKRRAVEVFCGTA